jgi:hypothetical protein
VKQLWLCILLIIILTACAAVPEGGLGRCNQGLCVKLGAQGPFRYGEPLTLTITLTSDRDQDVNASLNIPNNLMIEQPKSPNDTAIDQPTQGFYSWKAIHAKANISKTITFKTAFSNEDIYQVVVYADANGIGTSDQIQIGYSKTGISVYFQGTLVPTRLVPSPTSKRPAPIP